MRERAASRNVLSAMARTRTLRFMVAPFARVAARLRLARLRLARSRLVRASARSPGVAPFARVAARLRLARLRLARSRLVRASARSRRLLVARQAHEPVLERIAPRRDGHD